MPMDQLIEMTLRLFAAAAVGAVIGINRDLHGKPAGVRMLGLVALGLSDAHGHRFRCRGERARRRG